MARQALIVGLGQFGLSVAQALAKIGVEVLAVDKSEDRVRRLADEVAEAVCLDAADEDALATLRPRQRDVCLCAIGDESREASIICTALLRQMGAPRIIARANNDVHARILTLVGAHRIVNPEQNLGGRLASQILHESVLGELVLASGELISEIEAPAAFHGRRLRELDLAKRHDVLLVGWYAADDRRVLAPDAERALAAGDVLLVVAQEGAVSRMLDRT